jgi:hypothetical protein
MLLTCVKDALLNNQYLKTVPLIILDLTEAVWALASQSKPVIDF